MVRATTKQTVNVREGVDDLLGDAVAEVVLLFRLTQIDKGENGDALLRNVFGRGLPGTVMPNRHHAITARSTPMMTKSRVRPLLRDNRFARLNFIGALDSFRGQLVGPGQNECDRKTEQQYDHDQPGSPGRNLENREKSAS